ncbi:MBL fold metallo-hydrolase [Candidatus Nitrososphaera sp. FF02]|uniref:MBL fold metallo-hydrolase n=1 Tax=Candidatus Nitrososphaera sp. FF02 TaxID=3398226 RepID=UPI0039E93075
MPSDSKITFYGGVHEVGGNKFLVEDKGTRIFLDFGMQMGKLNQYFGEFLQPRAYNGLNDLLEFGLLPNLKGLYRPDYVRHTRFEDVKEPEFDAVVLTHAHLDHAAYIHYLRPDIPVYCSEASLLLMKGLQETGGKEEYVTFKRNFQLYKNTKGEMSRQKGEDIQEPRKISVFENAKSFKLDSIEVEPLAVDHSVPGVSGLILHTSKASIAYTADIRYHGRRAHDTQRFVDRCKESDIDIMLCEGTRVNKKSSKTEADVENDARRLMNSCRGLVVCSYPPRDLDRLLSFFIAAKESGRSLAIDLKQAYMLKLFQQSDTWKKVLPSPESSQIKIYIPKKSWGLIDKDPEYWTQKQISQDYDTWEREFLDYKNAVDYRDVAAHQKEMAFFCSDYQLLQLIDVKPMEGSAYIRSVTEPFNDEMELKEERVKRWLVHFGLLKNEKAWKHSHVSGHGSGDQIKHVIEGSNAKTLIPIHTEHEEYHKKWHNNVVETAFGGSLSIG